MLHHITFMWNTVSIFRWLLFVKILYFQSQLFLITVASLFIFETVLGHVFLQQMCTSVSLYRDVVIYFVQRLTATHTQELVFISGRDFQVMWGWRTWVGWSVDRFLGRAGQRESCAGLPCPSVSSEVAEPYPRTEYNSHGIDSSFLRWALRNFKRPFI